MRHLAMLPLLVMAVGVVQAQQVRFVTDSLKLEARSGPAVSNRIVRMLDSGTRVEVLEERDGWSRILLDGEDAWMLSRFLMEDPSARDKVAAAAKARETAQTQARRAADQLATATATVGALEEERDALASRLEALSNELSALKRTASSALTIAQENKRLSASSTRMSEDLEAMREEVVLLRRRQEREWFIAGAGVLLGGMILGLIIPKIRWRRKRGWGEL